MRFRVRCGEEEYEHDERGCDRKIERLNGKRRERLISNQTIDH